MADRLVPGTGFIRAFYNLAADGWKDGFDQNMLILSALAAGKVISRTTALPTGSDGDIYIVRSDAGANANSVAVKDDGTWKYFAPGTTNRWVLYVEDVGQFYYWQGASWIPFAAVEPPRYALALGIGATPLEDSEILPWIPFTAEVAFAAGMTDLVPIIGTPTAGGDSILIRKRNLAGAVTTVGTLSVSSGGDDFTGGFDAPTSFLRGEGIRLEADGSASDLASWSVAFDGARA